MPRACVDAAAVLAQLVGALVLARIEHVARRSDAILDGARGDLKARLGSPSPPP